MNKNIQKEKDNNINNKKEINEKKIDKDSIFESIKEPLFIKYLKKISKKNVNNNKDKEIKNFPPIKKIGIKKTSNKKRYPINYMRTNSSDKNITNIIDNSKKSIDSFNNSSMDCSSKKYKDLMKYNLYELNNLNYEEASKVDKRTYFQYYISLLKTKHLLIFSFYPVNDYNSKIIKIYLFFFSFSIYITINALFFDDDTMHTIYKDGGTFNFIYQIPQILYSSLISSVLNTLLKSFALSERNVLEVKNEKNIHNIDIRANNVRKILYCKFIIFFIISFILLLSFGYYLSCFCAVYKNTQTHLLKDSAISFGLSTIYPFIFLLLPGLFRIPSLKDPKKNKETLYKFSKIIQLM